jgi:hypothetical protein
MNHKRRRPKNRRAGCLLCKPWKANGAKDKHKARVRASLEWALEEYRSTLAMLADS